MPSAQLARLDTIDALKSHRLPPRIRTSVKAATQDVLDVPTDFLSDQDLQACANMVQTRRLEFLTGRLCAAEALTGVDHPHIRVGRQPDRSPRWPNGTVGSISHSHGLCWAAAALTSDYRALGIDLELIRCLTPEVRSVILTNQDLAHVAQLRERDPHCPWELIMFSAKESTYKVWQPLTSRWLGYQDAHITILPERGEFTVSILDRPPPDLSTLCGTYSHYADFVCSSIALTH